MSKYVDKKQRLLERVAILNADLERIHAKLKTTKDAIDICDKAIAAEAKVESKTGE